MKPGLWSSLVSSLRCWLDRIFSRAAPPPTTLHPNTVEDLVAILAQARDNGTSLKIVGGSFPVSSGSREDIVVSLARLDRLLGLDTAAATVRVEPGMRLHTLLPLLQSVNLRLELAGRVPDLALADCLALGGPGLGSGLVGLGSSILQVEAVTAGGELVRWNWDQNPRQLGGLVGGLGLIAAVISVTLQCRPLVLVTEISYLSSVREVMESWHLLHRTSDHQQVTWFPFTELVIITHTTGLDKLGGALCQSRLAAGLTEVSEWAACLLRRVSLWLCLTRCPALLTCLLARLQFISLWSAARYRSDHALHPTRLLPPGPALQGTSWLLPLDSVPPLLHSVSCWAARFPGRVTSPLFLQTLQEEEEAGEEFCRSRASSTASRGSHGAGSLRRRAGPRGRPGSGYLSPRLESGGAAALVWYDWFPPHTDPEPLAVSRLEELFLAAGGARCGGAGRLVSPLLLSNTHPQYRDWCRVKAELDPDGTLDTGYVQGTVYFQPAKERVQ